MIERLVMVEIKTVADYNLIPKRHQEPGRSAQWPVEVSRGGVGRL